MHSLCNAISYISEVLSTVNLDQLLKWVKGVHICSLATLQSYTSPTLVWIAYRQTSVRSIWYQLSLLSPPEYHYLVQLRMCFSKISWNEQIKCRAVTCRNSQSLQSQSSSRSSSTKRKRRFRYYKTGWAWSNKNIHYRALPILKLMPCGHPRTKGYEVGRSVAGATLPAALSQSTTI